MTDERQFHICLVCFRVCEAEGDCHHGRKLQCDAGEPDDDRRKPVADEHGQLLSRAPRWFLEALGVLKSG
ncbi:MAG TPA: hypothetical protein VJ436_10045 [Anaerolineales bacterium]|nr:hypothetical protein [Anaerolineales bacterium]